MSYIRGLRIERFRGIREGAISGLAQVNIILGPNGSGKSSILEAVYLASSCALERDPFRLESGGRWLSKKAYIIMRRAGRGDWDTVSHLLWYQADTSRHIVVELDVNGVLYRFHVPPRDSAIPIAPYLDWEGGPLRLEDARQYRDGRLVPARIPPELEELKRILSGVVFVDSRILYEPRHVEELLWGRIVARRDDREIVKILREGLEPEVEGITYVPLASGLYVLAAQLANTTVRVDDLGDGARYVLYTAMVVLGLRPTILLLEEPETHLHPSGIYSWLKVLIGLAKKYGIQVIAATHSLEVTVFAAKISKQLDVSYRAFFVERDREKGVLKTRTLEADDIEGLNVVGLDPRMLHLL